MTTLFSQKGHAIVLLCRSKEHEACAAWRAWRLLPCDPRRVLQRRWVRASDGAVLHRVRIFVRMLSVIPLVKAFLLYLHKYTATEDTD